MLKKTLGIVIFGLSTFLLTATTVHALDAQYQSALEYVRFTFPYPRDSQPSEYEAISTGAQNPDLSFYIFGDLNGTFSQQYLSRDLPYLMEKYGQRADFFYIHSVFAPNPGSLPMAIIGECVGQQGRFWENIPLLISQSEHLLADTPNYAVLQNVNTQELKACIDSDQVKIQVDNDIELSERYAQSSNPLTIIVNNRKPNERAIRLAGAVPFDYLDAAVTELEGESTATQLEATQQKLATVEAELAITKQEVSFLQQQVNQLNEFIQKLLATIRSLWK